MLKFDFNGRPNPAAVAFEAESDEKARRRMPGQVGA